MWVHIGRVWWIGLVGLKYVCEPLEGWDFKVRRGYIEIVIGLIDVAVVLTIIGDGAQRFTLADTTTFIAPEKMRKRLHFILLIDWYY